MTDERTPLEQLDEALALVVKAARWQAALNALPPGAPPSMITRVLAFASEFEDAGREAANKVRVALGGEPYPDPAEPPPVRPDE